ncbi:MAG: hypothetical protein NTZ97_04790 [Candidatus Moranbacteria bacterium]|nr:hypothetical protein [Candidatus Moranbacteria bacterium]
MDFSEGKFFITGEKPKEKKELDEKITGQIEQGPESKPEQLDMAEDLALRINDLYAKRLLTKVEAEDYMSFLNEYDAGKDNYANLALQNALNRIDLYAKEELLKAKEETENKSSQGPTLG